MSDFADLMRDVALALCGEPNTRLSSKAELRFGSNGSLAVMIDGPKKGTFFDHENQAGGGVLDLVMSVRGGDRRAALDWLERTFRLDKPQPADRPAREVARYPYLDETGALLFEVVRLEPKTFRQRRPDGRGGFDWSVKGVRQVPYRLPELMKGLNDGKTVFIAEGEKDVDRLCSLGVTATCNAGGAGKWKADFATLFRHANVVLLDRVPERGVAA